MTWLEVHITFFCNGYAIYRSDRFVMKVVGRVIALLIKDEVDHKLRYQTETKVIGKLIIEIEMDNQHLLTIITA